MGQRNAWYVVNTGSSRDYSLICPSSHPLDEEPDIQTHTACIARRQLPYSGIPKLSWCETESRLCAVGRRRVRLPR